MPRFTVRTNLAAKELFSSLGAEEIFSGRAELSKITDEGDLAISEIRHEAVLEITKDGTEGAAATGVELVFFSSALEDTKEVVVNQPFIFILQVARAASPSLASLILERNLLLDEKTLFFRIRRMIFL